nr:hypothetical protein [Tanacetum cinerariifolium]
KKPTVKYAKLYRRTSKSSKRVQMLKRELKARTSIQKVDRDRSRPVMAWVPKKSKSYDSYARMVPATAKVMKSLPVKDTLIDCPDCEVSRALSFCLSFTRASHP